MAFLVRCLYCKPAPHAVLTVEGFLDQFCEDALREHLRQAHPNVPVTATLGDLLRHFTVEPEGS